MNSVDIATALCASLFSWGYLIAKCFNEFDKLSTPDCKNLYKKIFKEDIDA